MNGRMFSVLSCGRISYLCFTRGLRGRTVYNSPAEALRNETSVSLVNEFKKVDNSAHLVQLLDTNASVLTARDLMAALAQLSQLQTSGEVPEDCLRLVCNRIVRFSRFFDLNELVNGVKYLNQMKLTPDSVVMQTLLQLIRKDLNQLSFRQIVFLDFLLAEVSQSSLVMSLRSSLPLIVRNHLDMQLNRSDVAELVLLFEFCSKHRFHPKDIAKIASALELHFPLPLNASLVVLWSVPSLGSDLDPFQTLIHHSVDVVTKNVDQTDVRGLLKLLERLVGRGFYSERLLSATGFSAIEERWSLNSIHMLLKLFSSIAYVDRDLLKACYRLMSEETRGVDLSFEEVVTNFAVANFNPNGLRFVLERQFLQQKLNFTDDRQRLKLALNLELLECHRGAWIQEDSVLGDDQKMSQLVQNCLEIDDREFLKIILLLDCTRKQLSAEISGSVIYQLRNHHRSRVRSGELPFCQALKRSLRDDRHRIYSGVLSKSGIFIDHVIVFNRGAAAFDGKDEEVAILEDVVHDSKGADLLVVLLRDSGDYSINLSSLLGQPAFESTVLRRQNLNVLEVMMDVWNEMPDWERLPFLSQRINETRKNDK